MTSPLHARNLWIVFAVAFGILVPLLQRLTGFGIDQAAFSAQGDATLRAAGPAFAIWGLIYAGLIAMAIYQLTPAGRAAPVLRRLAAPAGAAIALCGVWIIVAALNLRWVTVPVIIAAAGLLVWSLARAEPAEGRDRLFIVWPLQLLAGWLTIASGLNLLMVLTAEGWIQPQAYWSLIGIAGVVAAAAWSSLRLGSAIYLGPVIWGFLWVFEAMTGVAAWAALGAAGVLALLAVALLMPGRLPLPMQRRS